jgi:hypothetical protein
MSHQLELNRKHIAGAFVEYCKRRSGGHPVCTVKVKRKQVILGELSTDAVCRCLKDCFEAQCHKEYGQAGSTELLTSTYSSMTNKDNSKLTEEGIEFMADIMSNAVEIALKDPKNNSLGLEMY